MHITATCKHDIDFEISLTEIVDIWYSCWSWTI